jgi:hypothetical protein
MPPFSKCHTKTKIRFLIGHILAVLLLFGCHTTSYLQGNHNKNGLNSKTVSSLSLFNNKIIMDEQPKKNKQSKFIHLLYSNDSITQVITGKKNIYNKRNTVFKYLSFAGGNLLTANNLLKYQHVDSAFFIGDTYLIKNTVLALNPLNEPEIEVAYFTLYFFDTKAIYRSEYTWHKNTDGFPMSIIHFLRKWSTEKDIQEKKIQIPYKNETKEQAQLTFLSTYF